jgi:Mannosyl-glycoprotein endo-beta-N-acetylglucosaminidase
MTPRFRNLISLIVFSYLCLALLVACGSASVSQEGVTATPPALGLAYRSLPDNYYVTATAQPATPTNTPIPFEIPTLPPLPTPRPTQDVMLGAFRSSGSLRYVGGDDVTVGEPTAAAIDNWLARFGSPHLQEAPPGQTIGAVYVKFGRKYGINPAYALAFFTKESTCGTAGSNLASRNFGNIRWTPGYPTIDKVWRAYNSWTDGLEDWFKLITNEYLARGLRTVEQILPIYAPPFENDTELYIAQVKQWSRAIMGDTSTVAVVTRKPAIFDDTTPQATTSVAPVTSATPAKTPTRAGTPAPASTSTISPSRPQTRP